MKPTWTDAAGIRDEKNRRSSGACITGGRIWFPLAAKVEMRRILDIHPLAVQPDALRSRGVPSIWSTLLTKVFGENGLARN